MKRLILLVSLSMLSLTLGSQAQSVSSYRAAEEGAQTASKTATPTDSIQGNGFARWFDIQSATLSVRYRFVESGDHKVAANHLQHQEAIRGRFKFDAAGRYSLNTLVSSGPHFTLSWSHTGIGTGQGTTNLYLKQLYFAAQPFKGVEFQYGSIPFARGETTEIIGYDNDGYLAGGRIGLKRPEKLFFDEIAVTYAYLGNFNQPGVNKRFHRLKQSNYHQFLVSKKLSKRATVSADYTFHNGAETLRQAIKLNLPELRLVDSLRFENYERIDVRPAYGFALAGEKKVTKRLTLTAGYTQIDSVVGALNADRLGQGKHIYLLTSFALTPELTISTFLSHSVGGNTGRFTRAQGEVILGYNLLKALKRVSF